MSNYSKITDYAAKDLLLHLDPAKVVKGTEVGAEFDAIATMSATKTDSATLAAAGGAALVGNTPSGSIAATTVQAAINELATEKQATDATLTSISSLGTAADKLAYTTGVDTWAETPLTAAARTVLDDTTVGAMLTTLGGAELAGSSGQAFACSTLTASGSISGSNLSGTNTGNEVAATISVSGIVELATTAETQTGTDSNRVITPAGMKGAIGFSKVFVSSDLAITGSSVMSAAHGLGVIPAEIRCDLICISTSDSYATNDIICFNNYFYSGVGLGNVGADATNVFFPLSGSINVTNKSSTVAVSLTLANWRMRFKAWV